MKLQNIQGHNIREWIDELLYALNEEELRVLHHKVAERLRVLNSIRAKDRISQFDIGDKVVFDHQDQPIFGTIIRLNQRTVSVHTNDHRTWRVSPTFLRKIVRAQ